MDKDDAPPQWFYDGPQPEWPDVPLPPPGPGKLSDTAKQVQVVAEQSKKAEHAQWVDSLKARKLAEKKAERWAQRQVDEEEAEAENAEHAASWEAHDLRPILDGTLTEATPSVGVRTDGKRLFYPGINWLHGDSDAGKSFLMAFVMAQELAAGNVVVCIDYEEPDATTLVPRLLAMGADPDAVDNRLHFLHPETRATGKVLEKLVAKALARAGQTGTVTLLVLDSVGEAFGVEGINEDSDWQVAPWVNKVLRKLATALPGAAIVPIDHVVKNGDADAKLHPSGSKRKRAALTGISYLLVNEEPFSRDHAGQSKLIVAKDRHGNFTKKDVAARLHVRPEKHGEVLDVELRAPQTVTVGGEVCEIDPGHPVFTEPGNWQKKVREALELRAAKGATVAELAEFLEVGRNSRKLIYDALEALEAGGEVGGNGAKRNERFWLAEHAPTGVA